MSRRILLAGLFHETNTFVEPPTGLGDFQILRGEELLRCAGDSSPWGGALEAARQFGWTVLPTIDFRASPSGMVEDEVVATFWREFSRRAEKHLEAGIDALYLVLHGAMVAQSFDDVEGEILERIRRWPGAANWPIFGVFDLHANFTQRMASHSNCLVAYRENPHTDAREIARRAAALLEKSLATRQVPRTYWAPTPIIWPPTGTGTADEPIRSLETLARQIESENPGTWAVNVMAGFSFADVPETGVSFSIVTVGSESDARAQLARLSQLAWQKKELGIVIDPPAETAIGDLLSRTAVGRTCRSATSGSAAIVNPRPSHNLNSTPKHLTVLVEPSDNIGAGAPGDGTGLLRVLIQHHINNAAIAINDPEAVRRLADVPVGGKAILPIGGKGSALDLGPLDLPVELISRSDGKFQLEDKQSHLASMAGDNFDMGPCAVVRHEGILILLTSRKTPPFDLGQWRSQGIDPAELSVIVVKAAVAHRRAYDAIAARMIWVDTPGPCSSNLSALPYRRVRRPVYPLDPQPSSQSERTNTTARFCGGL